MATTPVFIKGQACIIEGICFYTSDGTLVTGWTGADATLSQDGTQAVAATNNPVEIEGVVDGSDWGVGSLTLTSGETNCDRLIVLPSITNSGAIIQPYVIYFSDGLGDIPVNAVAISDSTTAANNVEANIGNLDAAVSSVGAASVEDIVDGIEASPIIDSIYDKTLQIGTANATILTPVAPSGTLVINRGVSMTKWASMVYDCRLIADFDEATHPVKLFIDYGNGSKLVKTIGTGAILETADAIRVDLAPTFTSAVTRDMPLGTFPAQIVAFTDSSAERHIILELTIQVKAPGFDYSASDT